MTKSILDKLDEAEKDVLDNCSCDLEISPCDTCVVSGYLFAEHIRALIDVARAAEKVCFVHGSEHDGKHEDLKAALAKLRE